MSLPRPRSSKPATPADDTEIVARMRAICDEFGRLRLPSRRRRVVPPGDRLNSKRVRRLMRVHDLQPRRRRRFVTTTDSAHDRPIFPDGPRAWWSTLRTSSGSPTSPTSRSRPASSIWRDPRCLVAPSGRLCDQPVGRCPTDAGGPQGRAPYSSTSCGLHASFRSRGAVRLRDLPPTARRAWPGRLDGTAGQSHDNAKAESS